MPNTEPSVTETHRASSRSLARRRMTPGAKLIMLLTIIGIFGWGQFKLHLASQRIRHPIPKVVWTSFSPPGSDFTVIMPGDPTFSRQSMPLPGTNLTLYRDLWSAEGATNFYDVGFVDYPPQADERWLDAAAEYLKTIPERVTLSDRAFREKDIPVRELVQTTTDGKTTLRLYLVGSRLFSISATCLHPQLYEHDVEEFLNSFKITARKDSVPR